MINQQDLTHFGARLQRANVTAGNTYWKLIEVRHTDPNREFGGDQHVFIEALDEQGNKLRQLQAQINQGDEIHHPLLDKGLNEPGTNWPLWKGSRVFVSMGETSDLVGPLHTEMDAYKGGDWHHHSWYLVFQRTVADGEQPVDGDDDDGVVIDPGEPTDTLTPAILLAMREQAWNQVHVPFNRDSTFAQYARQQKLGAPLTAEYDVGTIRAQGFANGIVYAQIGHWDNVQHVGW